MTDEIRKQIEEEAKRIAKETDLCPTLDGYEEINNQHKENIGIACIDISGFILSKWREAERWRKVEEELPEWKGEEFSLLVKKIGEYGVTYNIFPVRSEKSIVFLKDLHDEWKPIHTEIE